MPRSYSTIQPGLLLPEDAATLNDALADLGTLMVGVRTVPPMYCIQDGGGVVIGLDLQSDAAMMSVPAGTTVTNYGAVVYASGSTVTFQSGSTFNFNAGSIVNFYAATYTFQSNTTFLFATSATTVTFAGFVIVQDLVACSDWWYCYTSLTWNTDKTDYDQTTNKVLWLLNVTGAVNLTGIIPRTTVTGYSQQLTLVNITTSTNSITVKNDSTSSAANRILTPGGTDYVVAPGYTLILQYDPTANASVGRWRVITPPTGSSTSTGGLTKVNVYTSGANTWTKPAGLVSIEVWVVGGGGGGAGAAASNSGGGGGGGGCAYSRIAAATLGATETATVGGGGGGGAATPAAGTNGTDSTFTVSGGFTMTGGGGVGAPLPGGGVFNTAGDGGSVTNSNAPAVNVPGGGGDYGLTFSALAQAGGRGGASGFGTPPRAIISGGGTTGSNYGTGGGGASNNAAGGAGAGGVIVIKEYS